MALGASVQPLTRITPMVSVTAMNNRGLAVICCQNCKIESISYLSFSLSSLVFVVGMALKPGSLLPTEGFVLLLHSYPLYQYKCSIIIA
jgi:hypothetical protein